jgi:hypothetical protein
MAATDEVIPMEKWLAPSKIRFFRFEGSDAPGRNVTFRLENQLISDTLSRTFEPASRDSYLLMVKAPNFFSSRLSGSIYKEDEVLGAELAIEKHEELLNDFLDVRTAQVEQRLKEAGHTPDSIDRRFKTYEAKVVTSFATNLLDIYQKADYLYTLHYSLWLLGELADSTIEANRVNREFQKMLKQNLHGYSAAMTQHANNIRSLMERLIEERREFQKMQSKRDKEVRAGKEYKELEKTEEGKAAARDRKKLRTALPKLIRQLEEEVGVVSAEPAVAAA